MCHSTTPPANARGFVRCQLYCRRPCALAPLPFHLRNATAKLSAGVAPSSCPAGQSERLKLLFCSSLNRLTWATPPQLPRLHPGNPHTAAENRSPTGCHSAPAHPIKVCLRVYFYKQRTHHRPPIIKSWKSQDQWQTSLLVVN